MTEKRISKVNAKTFDDLHPQLKTTFEEMKELAKKKADAALNKYKVSLINRILSPLKEFLKDQSSANLLDILSDVDLPSNSDAVLVMAQYVAAMKTYRGERTDYHGWNYEPENQTEDDDEYGEEDSDEMDDEGDDSQ